MNRNRVRFVPGVLAALIWVFCAGPGTASADNPSSPPIRLGAIAVLSGEGASWGVNLQRGILLAVDEINAGGGIKGKTVEVVFEDSPSGIARNAVTAYTKLAKSNGIKFIFGPVMMDELLAVAPMAKRDGVFLGGATYMPNAPANFFTTWIDADVESDLLAKHVFERHRKVAVLSSQQSWESQIAHRFKDTFTKLGGKIEILEEPSFEAIDVKSEVLKARQKQPSAIFISSYLLLPKYIKELKRLGMNIPIFGIELDQSIIDNSGEGAEGLIFIAPETPSDEFLSTFKNKWHTGPDIPAANAYDSAKLLARAISEKGEDVEGVIDFFQNFKGYNGATGHIERRDGKTVISTAYYVVSKGKIVRIN